MAWGRIDDKLYSHRKTMRIPRAHRCEAMGLWVLADSWCNNHGTDGNVPRDILDEFGTTEEIAQLLVNAGYWVTTEEGYQFVNWGDFNLTSDDLESKRTAETERKRKWRESKKAKSEASLTNVPAGQEGTVTDVPDGPAMSPLTHTHTQSHTHKRDSSSKNLSAVPAGPKEPAGFAEFWATYPRRESKGAALKAYSNALKKVDLDGIRAGALRYANDPNRDDRYTKMPATWLNGECWSDDPLPDRAGPAQHPAGPPAQSRADQKVQGYLDMADRLTTQPEHNEPLKELA